MSRSSNKKPEDKQEQATDPEPLSKEEMEQAMAGFVFPRDKGKTPMDYLRDPNTGTVGSASEPWGVKCIDLRGGIEGADLPAKVFWDMGEWMTSIEYKDRPLTGLSHVNATDMWVVTGNGMPNNYIYYVYLIPNDGDKAPATYEVPKHPALWIKKYKDGKAKLHHGNEGPFGKTAAWTNKTTAKPWSLYDDDNDDWYRGHSWSSKQTTPATQQKAVQQAQKQVMPAGLRIRCRGCGHWFKDSDLQGHATSTCPGTKDNAGETDWAVMCATECGCKTLDQVAQCKPGYPKTKQKEEVTTEPTTPHDTSITTHPQTAGGTNVG